MTPIPPESPNDALRLVLFGLAGSGKSSLLSALGQVSKAQDSPLGSRIEDRGNRLGSISGANGERSKSEITAYPVYFVPGKGEGDVEAVLVDSDGLAASNLLTRRSGLDEDSPEGSLAYEVGDADGLILVLDASTPPGQVEGQFVEFARFLETVQKARGARAEVAGMPVFLVLNKCDTLAKPGDSLVSWVERIEQRKRDLAERFAAFLADRDEEKKDPPSEAPTEQVQEEELEAYTGTFGRIELHVWATAIRKPDLGGGKNGAQEPYGVAELFRQALAEGSEYQARCARAQRRLYVVSVVAVALVAVLLVFIVGLFALHRNTQLTMLESRVRDFEFIDSTGSKPGLLASVDQLRLKKTRLEEIQANSYFTQLRPEMREKVEATHKDMAEYITYFEKLQARRSPTSEQTESVLEESLKQLRAEQAELREKWKPTPVAPLLEQRITAGGALYKAVGVARDWYIGAQEEAERLYRIDGAGVKWPEWSDQVEKLLSLSNRPPFRPNDPIPNSPGTSLTYATALRFDTAENACRRWIEARDALRRLFAITSAVKLTTPREFKAAALLDFPDDFRLASTRQRLLQLETTNSEYKKRFLLEEVPQRLRPAVRRAALAQYQRLLKVGRAEVLARYRMEGKGGEETIARWEAVRTWLKSPEELAAWRELALALLRLTTSTPEDPVIELATFLGAKQFTIELDSITLEVREGSGIRPRAGTRLVILHKKQPGLTFEESGSEVLDEARGVVRFTFRRTGAQRIDYSPGDDLWAELPLTGGKEKLVWSVSRSRVYLIDRLRNAPRRQPFGETALSEGKIQADVRLIGKPEAGIQVLPDLLPWVVGE